MQPYYEAIIKREAKHFLAEFPDCPGCQTFADSIDEVVNAAEEALEVWLESHLAHGEVPPKSKQHRRHPPNAKVARVPVRAGLWAALMVRWARSEAGLSQAELARLANVSQQQIAKIENPDMNPTVGTLEKVAKALGLVLNLGFVMADVRR